jgi:hypothetical protein
MLEFSLFFFFGWGLQMGWKGLGNKCSRKVDALLESSVPVVGGT